MPDSQPDQFSLVAGPCAAAGYPMTVLYGVFTNPGQGRLTVPAGHHLEGDWTGSGTFESSKRLAAPDTLHLLWFSFLEDKFYEGSFALPQQRIHSLLKEGFWNDDENQQDTYDELTVCMLPKGAVVVWLSGQNKVLIGRYQGHATTFDFATFLPQTDRALMFKEILAEAPPEVRQEVQEGRLSTAKWDEYLKTYPWKVEVTERTGQRAVPLQVYSHNIDYLNAEQTRYPETKDRTSFLSILLEPSLKPVPTDFSLYVENEHAEQYKIRIDSLDEQETMAAFRELRAQSTRPMTLHVEVDGVYKKATLTLRHDYGQVVLQKALVEIYREN